jgi:competence protein ComEA
MSYVRSPVHFLPAIALLALASATGRYSAALLQAQSNIVQTAAATEPVDINTASVDQLMKVPGLARTWAARIIRFRPYRGKNELLDRGIVSAAVYARIKDHIIAHRVRN